VPLCTAEFGFEEVLRAIPGGARYPWSGHRSRLYSYRHPPHLGGPKKWSLTKRRAHAIHLVGSHGKRPHRCRKTRTPRCTSPVATARASGIAKIGGSRRQSHIPCCQNQRPSCPSVASNLASLPLHLESTVIRSYSYFHLLLPLPRDLALRRSYDRFLH